MTIEGKMKSIHSVGLLLKMIGACIYFVNINTANRLGEDFTGIVSLHLRKYMRNISISTGLIDI